MRGADSWLAFALQVSNQPAAGMALPGGPGTVPGPTPLQRAATRASCSAETRRGGASAAAGAAAWLAAALLAG
jgi:hypothetical protein